MCKLPNQRDRCERKRVTLFCVLAGSCLCFVPGAGWWSFHSIVLRFMWYVRLFCETLLSHIPPIPYSDLDLRA
jgi:hypothetical protein